MRKKNLLTGNEVDEPGGHDPDFYPAGTWGGGEDHDPELDELDAMWAEEHKRPQGHGKPDNLYHTERLSGIRVLTRRSADP